MLIAYISFRFWLFTESPGIFKATTDFKSNSKNILYNHSVKDGLFCFSDQPPSTPRPVYALRKMIAEDSYTGRLEYQRSQGNVAEIFYWGLGGQNLSWEAAHWVHCSNLTECSCRNMCVQVILVHNSCLSGSWSRARFNSSSFVQCGGEVNLETCQNITHT